METRIGAEELIYRIRKNRRCLSRGNKQLGRDILELIVSLGGSKYLPDKDSFWDIDPAGSRVNEFELPKTSEQYLIKYDMLTKIYNAIDTW
jgi:hypothetical protein